MLPHAPYLNVTGCVNYRRVSNQISWVIEKQQSMKVIKEDKTRRISSPNFKKSELDQL